MLLTREPILGRRLFGTPRYDLPVAFGAFGTPLPRRARMRFVVPPAIEPVGDPTAAATVERVRAATYDALDRVLATAR